MLFGNSYAIIGNFNQSRDVICFINACFYFPFSLPYLDALSTKLINTCRIFSLSAKTNMGCSHPFL